MFNLIRKVFLTLIGYVVGTIVIVIILSIFIKSETLPDGTTVLPSWTTYIIIIYWLFLFILIWKESIYNFIKKFFKLNSTYLVVNEDKVLESHNINDDQIKLINSIDPLLYEVVNYIIETERASTSNIQRRFGLGYNRSARIIDILESCGILGEAINSLPRSILSNDLMLIVNYIANNILNENEEYENNSKLKLIIKDPVLFSNDHQFYKLLEYVIHEKKFEVDEAQNLFNLNFAKTSNYINTLKLLKVIDENMNYILSDSESYESISDYIKYAFYTNQDYVSSMNLDMLNNGLEFESFIGNLLTKNNYYDVVITQASNDYGIDVTATKDGIKYAIQCKYYTSPVGNGSVQEVTAGKNHYNAHVGVVATNNYFTKNAIELAKSNNIILWDRDKILSMIKQ